MLKRFAKGNTFTINCLPNKSKRPKQVYPPDLQSGLIVNEIELKKMHTSSKELKILNLKQR